MFAARLLAAALGGVGLYLAHPGIDASYAAVAGVALLAWAARDVGWRRGFLVGLVGGLTCFVPLLSWSGVYVGPVPWFALAFLEALYVGLLGALLGGVAVRDALFPLWVGCVWVSTELARSTTPYGGFPWGRIAFSQSETPFARVAALLGAPGVTFAVALWATLLALTATRLAARPKAVRGVLLPAAGAVAVAVAPLLVPLPTDGPTARVMAIQGDVPQAGLDFNAQRRAVLDNHARLTERAAETLVASGAPRPDLVVWPENASDIDPLRNPDAAAVIRAAVAAIDAPTIVGAVLTEPADHLSNASLLYLPGQADPVQRYDKRHPVPFGEYIPHRDFFRFFSDKVDLVTRDFAAGSTVGVQRVPRAGGAPDVAAGINICFEVAADDLVRDGVHAGANLVVVQTNNATFGLTDESVQQLAISRIRAIEHGRSVVHISNVGVSSLITPDGATHGWTERFAPAVLTDDLPLRSEQTLATRLGDVPALLSAAVTVGAVWVSLTKRRRSGRTMN